MDRVVRGAQEVHDRDAGHLGRVLEREEDARLGTLVGREVEDVLAVVEDLARGDLVAGAARQHVGERRLAGAVRAHDGVDLALVEGEVRDP